MARLLTLDEGDDSDAQQTLGRLCMCGSCRHSGGLGRRASGRQGRESVRPDLSGRWQLNAELSDDAQAKLEGMHIAQGGGHGPGRHGLGWLFGGAPSAAQMEEARALLLNAPPSFIIRQEAARVVLTDSDGRVRTLNTNGRKEIINRRDVRTKWDQ